MSFIFQEQGHDVATFINGLQWFLKNVIVDERHVTGTDSASHKKFPLW